MTEYAILLPSNEAQWENASPEHRAAVHATHVEFAARLAERGHKITGGAELTGSREAVVVRNGDGGVVVTEGPYAETAEQLAGFYVVESDDLADLLQVAALLAGPEGGVEVRACVDHSGTA